MSAIFTDDRDVSAAGDASAAVLPPAARANWHARWITIFLVVGVAARLLRYLLRFPLWGDEAMLAMNLLDRDYRGLMQPLDFHQVSPLLFLWTELTFVKLLGFNEWALRLFPLLCSIASLFLFHRMAKMLLSGASLLLAVGIFAVSYSCLRYASEVKPYGVDLTVSTLLLMLAVSWWRQPNDFRWLWALTATVPLALGLSYPAVFISGGISLAIAAVLLGNHLSAARQTTTSARSSRGWIVWMAYNLALAGSFLAWYRLAVGAQSGAELDVMSRMWDDTFPPRDSIVGLVYWLVKVHAGPLMAVPVGGRNWGSLGTTLCCLVAVGVLLHKRRFRLIVLCTAPFALNLLAAALRRFPYGGHMRLAMHLAPLVCILAGIGLAAAFQWLSRDRARSRVPHAWNAERGGPITWPVGASAVLLLLLAVLSTARDFYLPGKEQQEIRKRDFAVWFWGSMEREHEVVGICADLKLNFPPPGATWQNCVSPQFLCNEQIYSPRAQRGESYDLGRVSAKRPLVCVQYWSHLTPYDQKAFNGWLEGMKREYDMISLQNYPMLQDNDSDRVPEPPDRVEVYQFVPRGCGKSG